MQNTSSLTCKIMKSVAVQSNYQMMITVTAHVHADRVTELVSDILGFRLRSRNGLHRV